MFLQWIYCAIQASIVSSERNKRLWSCTTPTDNKGSRNCQLGHTTRFVLECYRVYWERVPKLVKISFNQGKAIEQMKDKLPQQHEEVYRASFLFSMPRLPTQWSINLSLSHLSWDLFWNRYTMSICIFRTNKKFRRKTKFLLKASIIQAVNNTSWSTCTE